jgi:CRISPR-associated protein Csb1
MGLTPELLREASSAAGTAAGIAIRSRLEPIAGPGAPVKPATYAGGVYQTDRRWWGEGEGRRAVDAIVIDNAPSQANRLEAVLERRRAELGLPEVVLDLSDVGALPAHLPRSLSGFRFPHRHADAYLRDAILDGTPFHRADLGRRLVEATGDRALPILEWFPQALLYGFWQSHWGKKGTQAKLARSWVSEVVGFEPAQPEQWVEATKGDPLNLNIDEPILFDPDDLTTWSTVTGGAKAGKGAKEKLSEIGHGQVVTKRGEQALGPLSFRAIEQQSTVSFASLRKVHVGSDEQDAAARALVVALGLVAHVGAFGRAFNLRSGCDLRPRHTTWTWLGANEDVDLTAMDHAAADQLLRDVVVAAETLDLPVGSRWPQEPLVLHPNAELVKVIRKTWPLGDI